MKAKLIKTLEQLYKLKFYNDEDMLACATALLSKQNCDEIFGVVDVEKLAEKLSPNSSWKHGFIKGFNKAMELNKDKVFTLEDMKRAFHYGQQWVSEWVENTDHSKNKPLRMKEIIKSLIQPTEIEVQIVMEEILQLKKRAGGFTNMGKPKLDSSGNLILKKI
jgi:hypothetical protein